MTGAREDEAGPAASASTRRYAALDLGTNNCRLLVAEPAGRYFRVVDAFSRNVRLGEGVEGTGRLSDKAMDRAIDALRICAGKIRRSRPAGLRVIGTEACRRARNGGEFRRRVRRETGLPLEIVTPEQEARLAIAGCAPLLDPSAEHLMVFDIGGGSTELIWIDLSAAAPDDRENLVMALAPGEGGPADADGARVLDWVSAPLGVATLHDRFADVEDDRERFALMAW